MAEGGTPIVEMARERRSINGIRRRGERDVTTAGGRGGGEGGEARLRSDKRRCDRSHLCFVPDTNRWKRGEGEGGSQRERRKGGRDYLGKETRGEIGRAHV